MYTYKLYVSMFPWRLYCIIMYNIQYSISDYNALFERLLCYFYMHITITIRLICFIN